MKTKILFPIVLLLILSCSHIDEDERLLYVKPVAVSSSVLIEDFTGQRCINCPSATDEILRLQELYGEEAVIAVAIHCGPFAFTTNSRLVGLKNDLGDEYYNYWHPDHQPIGMINRGEMLDYSAWNAEVREYLQQTSPVSINLSTVVFEGILSVQVEVMGTDGDTDGHLQVWLVEDNIVAFQLLPDGTRRDDFLHRHVLRAAVNGTWGTPIRVTEGETSEFRFSNFPLDDEWTVSELSVVAFVYNERGVCQVTSRHV